MEQQIDSIVFIITKEIGISGLALPSLNIIINTVGWLADRITNGFNL